MQRLLHVLVDVVPVGRIRSIPMPPAEVGVSSTVVTFCPLALTARSTRVGRSCCGISVSTMLDPAAATCWKCVRTFAGVNCARIASCSCRWRSIRSQSLVVYRDRAYHWAVSPSMCC